MSIYVNTTGTVDDVKVEEKGLLSDDQEDQLKSAFRKFIFLPGMRGERVVKSVYRTQLGVNRRIFIRQ